MNAALLSTVVLGPASWPRRASCDRLIIGAQKGGVVVLATGCILPPTHAGTCLPPPPPLRRPR